MTDAPPPRRRRLGRVLLWTVLVIVAVWLLFSYVFPWVESRWYDPAVGLGHALIPKF